MCSFPLFLIIASKVIICFICFYQILKHRQDFIAYLKSKNINAVFHYVPLHTSDMGKGFGYKAGDLPVTESVSDRLVRLPFYNDLEKKDQDYVIQTINKYHIILEHVLQFLHRVHFP